MSGSDEKGAANKRLFGELALDTVSGGAYSEGRGAEPCPQPGGPQANPTKYPAQYYREKEYKKVQRYLVIRIPLRDSDPYDVIQEIDRGRVNIPDLMLDRFEDLLLAVETGDKVHS